MSSGYNDAKEKWGARWTGQGALLTAKTRAAWLSGTWDILATKRAALPLAS